MAHILTAGSSDRFGKDNVALWGSGALPLNTLVADDGVTILTSADFTWVNQGGAGVTDQNGTVVIRRRTTSEASIVNYPRQQPRIRTSPHSKSAAIVAALAAAFQTSAWGFATAATAKWLPFWFCVTAQAASVFKSAAISRMRQPLGHVAGRNNSA